MEVARNGLSARRWVLVALIALLGLAVTAVGSSSAASGAGRDAVAAKKKCKKKRSAGVAKKKKCKKVRHVVLPAPLVRATLAWSAGSEVDLHAYDASGNHSGFVATGPTTGSVVQGIPNALHSGDVGPGGPRETFTDNIFVAGGTANREFSYIACLYNFPSSTPYTATFTGVTKTGASSSVPLSGPAAYTLTVPGGPAVPDPGSVC
jgi:hypothetical protein